MQATNPLEGGCAALVDIGAALDRIAAVLRPETAGRRTAAQTGDSVEIIRFDTAAGF